VGVDGKCLRDRVGGIARYVDGVVSSLRTVEDALEIEVVTPDRPTRTVPWILWRLQRVTGAGWGAFHFPFYYPPLRPRCPVTVVIHDLLPIEHPEWFPSAWAAVTARLIRAGARVTAGIVTPCEDVARRVEDVLRYPRARVCVAPHGVDPTAFSKPSARDVDAVRRRHRLNRPYLLLVGPFEVRRGLDLAIAAARELRGAYPDLELALVGEARMEVSALAAAPPWVRVLGFVDDTDLPALYGGAAAVLAPSRGEGFDFPVAEAMACGAAVVASDIPAHAELFGDAVATFPSGDAEALAAAVRSVLDSSELTATLHARALQAAKRFDWSVSARAHAALWREVAGC
jgi:alpha-1,3-rhamnosyl/mannosyltransferase